MQHKAMVLLSVTCALCCPEALAAGRPPAHRHATLADLTVQTYPVPDVPADRPIDPASLPFDGRPPRTEITSFGLVPERYSLEWASRAYWPDDGAADLRQAASPQGTLEGDALSSWSLGARSWRYAGSAGYGIAIGNEATRAPAWGRSVRLAGVSVHGRLPGSASDARRWRYAAAAGRLDESGGTVASGGLEYGPLAYDVSSEYAVGPGLSLASQVQGMPELLALGLGGTYTTEDWGSVALGVSRSQESLDSGWRYQMGYRFDVFSDLELSWVNERRGAGYVDLASYRQDPLACDCVRHEWQLSVPMGRWGSLSGTYERRRRAREGLEQSLGLAQGFQWGPHLEVRLEASGNIATGAYGLGARFAVPLD